MSRPMAAMAQTPMFRDDGGFLANNTNLFVKQTRKGCFQELLGCEANTEFKIATMENQTISTEGPTGSLVEDCWCCVPSLRVVDASGTHKYNFLQPTCCCGMCVNVCAEGCCNCRIPFYIFPPGQSTVGQEKGSVVKVWAGMKSEFFTDADKFEVYFPSDDSASKTTLLGGVFLLNQLFFEGKK
ncbi:hypothetical protein B484DRAFT_441779 [Ochromonadaceae sp. CCMP2298]|nr:hypothetical protein B484DRAFT_441779 [Ochromonadaceae sp. CCMP2298]